MIIRDATGVVLHKDSKWYQQWKEFKDNNPVVTGKSTYFVMCLRLRSPSFYSRVIQVGQFVHVIYTHAHLLCLGKVASGHVR